MGERLTNNQVGCGSIFIGGFLIYTDNLHNHTGAFTSQSRVAL